VNHEQAERLLQGYVDGELELRDTLGMENHLETCEICARVYQEQWALHSALATGALYYRAPAQLSKRIQSSIRPASAPPLVSRRILQYWPALAVALVILVVGLLGVVRLLPTLSPDNQVATEVLSSHLRSLMATHLTDVASSDQHTVKPWFDGKVDFSPTVVDLAAQGFPLIGGRLDYLDHRTVAALVYQRRLHIINLFIWPTGSTDTTLHSQDRQGYHLFYWNQSGMTYWAVSDVSVQDMQTFVQLIQHEIAPASTP
jgi:anti-sigma factor RsiW